MEQAELSFNNMGPLNIGVHKTEIPTVHRAKFTAVAPVGRAHITSFPSQGARLALPDCGSQREAEELSMLQKWC